jgi:hypothetical protein
LSVFPDSLPGAKLFDAFKVDKGSIQNVQSQQYEEFDPSPAGLVRQAKRVLTSDLGLLDPSLLDDTKFRWIGPALDRPLGKTEYLAALRFFDLRSAFPDYDYRSYDYRVVGAEGLNEGNDLSASGTSGAAPNTVRFTCRVTGTMRGELRLRDEVLSPTGTRMICPPEAVSMTFDLRSGKLLKLCTGFCLDRQVGNTGGTLGVLAAASAAGKPPSDWELYPPLKVIGRFFGRPEPQLPEPKAFLAPFPETVMVQLAKGVVAAGMAGDDPTLLSDDFTYVTPSVGPVRKAEFLEKYAAAEFENGLIDPVFSFWRVDPYDPVRVWVDLSPTAPGYQGPPQAMSFTFDDEGFCTRITSGAVMDPSVGNGGGLGGPAGYRYATGNGGTLDALSTRPLPRILGRLRKQALQPFTKVSPDDYVLPGQTVTPFAERPQTSPAERVMKSKPSASSGSLSPALRLLSKPSGDSAVTIKRREIEEATQRAIKAKEEAEKKLEAQRVATVAAAQAKKDAEADEKRRQAEARVAEAERRKAENLAEAERRQKEMQLQRKQQLAAQQAAVAARAAQEERRKKEVQAQRDREKSAIAARKAEAERKQQEAREQRDRQIAAQRAEAERKRRELLEVAIKKGEAKQRENAARERKRLESAVKAEADRERQLALKESQARTAAERAEAERKKRELEQVSRREKQARQEEERRKKVEADKQAQLARQAAAREAAAAAAESQRRLQAFERQREIERQKEQEEARRISEQRRKADEEARSVAKKATAEAQKIEQERQRRQKAAEEELKRARSSATLNLFGLGGQKTSPATAEQQRQKAASDAASQAKPGSSIPLFFLSGTESKPSPKDYGASKRQRASAAAEAVAKAKSRSTISLFGLGGGSQDEGKQQRQKLAKIAAAQAKPRTSISLFGLGGEQAKATPKATPSTAPRPTLSLLRASPSPAPKSTSAPSDTGPRPTLSLFGASSPPAAKPTATASSTPRPTLSLFGQASSPASVTKKIDSDRETRKKAALDTISKAPPRGTVSLFGLGGGSKTEVKPPPLPPPFRAGGVPAAKKAPPGVPTLKSWRKNPGGDTVTGIISGSRSFPDGEKVTTSKIVSGKLASGEVIRTGSGSRYFLL